MKYLQCGVSHTALHLFTWNIKLHIKCASHRKKDCVIRLRACHILQCSSQVGRRVNAPYQLPYFVLGKYGLSIDRYILLYYTLIIWNVIKCIKCKYLLKMFTFQLLYHFVRSTQYILTFMLTMNFVLLGQITHYLSL